jgi:hypothetical protein
LEFFYKLYVNPPLEFSKHHPTLVVRAPILGLPLLKSGEPNGPPTNDIA